MSDIGKGSLSFSQRNKTTNNGSDIGKVPISFFQHNKTTNENKRKNEDIEKSQKKIVYKFGLDRGVIF